MNDENKLIGVVGDLKLTIEDDNTLLCAYLKELGGKRTRQSVMLLKRPNQLVLWQDKAMMAFRVFNNDPKSSVVLGLGGGGLTKYLYHHFKTGEVISVEIEEDVIEAAQTYFKVPSNNRSKLFHGDALQLIAKCKTGTKDLIISDTFGGGVGGFIKELNTEGYYGDIKRVLSYKGIAIFNIPTKRKYVRGALGKVFEGRVLLISKMCHGNQVMLCFKSDQGMPTLETLTGRADDLAAQDPSVPYRSLLAAILKNNKKTSCRLII